MSFREIQGVLHDDPPMTAESRAAIRVLGEADSAAAWDELVSPAHRHFMLLPVESWPARLVASSDVFFAWQADWNANASEAFEQQWPVLVRSSTGTRMTLGRRLSHTA